MTKWWTTTSSFLEESLSSGKFTGCVPAVVMAVEVGGDSMHEV